MFRCTSAWALHSLYHQATYFKRLIKCINILIYFCVYTYIYTYIYLYIYIHIFTHIHLHMYIYMNIYINAILIYVWYVYITANKTGDVLSAIIEKGFNISGLHVVHFTPEIAQVCIYIHIYMCDCRWVYLCHCTLIYMHIYIYKCIYGFSISGLHVVHFTPETAQVCIYIHMYIYIYVFVNAHICINVH
jgi:hypothetical protein